MKLSTTYTLALAALVTLAASGCQSPYYNRDRGALLGGLAGAGLGAAIGDHNGNALAGTAIGAGVGALTGAAIGNTVDQEVAHEEARENAIIQASLGRPVTGAATMNDVIAMTQAGVSESIVINHINTNGVAQQIGVNEVLALHQAGVSAPVIQAMQTPVARATPYVATAPAPRPVIIQERHYVAPRPCYHDYWGRPHCYDRPAIRFSFGGRGHHHH